MVIEHVTPAGGNIFADLGFAGEEAENLKIRSWLMMAVHALIQERGLKQDVLATIRAVADAFGTTLGVQVAHSGTVAGFLFEPGAGAAERIECARTGLRRLGFSASWEFSTELASHPEVAA